MPKKEKKERKPLSRKAKIIIPVAVVVGLVILIIGGFTVGMALEDHNSFCGSCHTQPELTYLQQSTVDPAPNLASFHISQEDVRCVQCHSGPGVTGRAITLVHGLLNGVKLWTGNASQPGKFEGKFPVANCTKCHADFIASASPQGSPESGHWHFYLAQWEKVDPSAGTCASCHEPHITTGDPSFSFINRGDVQQVCSACHGKLRSNQ